MKTIFDYVNAQEMGTYIEENPSNQEGYLGQSLFPAKKVLGLDLKWIRGSKGLPISITPSAFDAKATLRDRIGFKEISTEMPFFREGVRIGEKDRQELNKVLASNNNSYIFPIINSIYDDVARLVEGVDVVNERMRMQLLSVGRIDISANRINYTYNYNMPSEHKETLLSTAKWSDFVNSNPVSDIQRWQKVMQMRTGKKPVRAICTTKTWNYIMLNQKIKFDMSVTNGERIIMTDNLMKQYISTKLSLNIEVYDKMYDLNGTATQFFPDDVFTLIPNGSLGSTYFGTTPEESDLMGGGTDADVKVIKNGVALTTVKESHPVNIFTICSAITMPSFECIDDIFIATVA